MSREWDVEMEIEIEMEMDGAGVGNALLGVRST